MLFNSYPFLFFFLIVFALYLCCDHEQQNWLLLIASYIFYGWWDWRFLSLLWITTAVDYGCALAIERAQRQNIKKRYLLVSMVANLTLLGFFKYFNFFSESFYTLARGVGWRVDPFTLKIILPVGISFYTFQTMSYVIDVYRNRLRASRKIGEFALFIAFFPQLVAGPIERATHLLPQIQQKRQMSAEKFFEGCYLIFWGLFQKVFIADHLAQAVDKVFSSQPPYQGAAVLLGVYAFAFQILCDFSGYSNMARGLGLCMGFDIMVNFKWPYFSTNPREFWTRWHISLSTWLKDYLYVSLGGNRKGNVRTYINLMTTMVIAGLWHGAAWKFVAWGGYHGLLLCVHRAVAPILKKIPQIENVVLEKFFFILRVFLFFNLVSLGWLLFRADSVHQALQMLQAVPLCFSGYAEALPAFAAASNLFCIFLILLIHGLQAWKNDELLLYRLSIPWNPIIQGLLFYFMIHMRAPGQQFIYFQF